MSFRNFFGGFCVIHAAFLHPQRAVAFTKELKRVGVDQFDIIYTERVESTDPRVPQFTNYLANAQQCLSLTDGWKAAVTHAQRKDWDSVVIFEDDIVFRKNFAQLWAEVESQARDLDWDVLVLHRFPEHELLIVESPKEKTELMPVSYNLLNHCVAIHSKAYSKFLDTLDYCLATGLAIDFFYGYISRNLGCSVYATNKNLTGQYSGYISSIQNRALNLPSFYRTFRCCESQLEYKILKQVYTTYTKFKNGK